MLRYFVGKKLGQSQMFTEAGVRIPVTRLSLNPTYIVDIKDYPDVSGVGIVIGYGAARRVNKPAQGKLTKAGIEQPVEVIKEFRYSMDPGYTISEVEGKKTLTSGESTVTVGQIIDLSQFISEGTTTDVAGISSGKGFQGVVKRHNFRGGPRTHGQSDRERAPGSIGAGTTPGRVLKGKRMAGRMGGDRITSKNLKVVQITENEVIVRGLVPGHKNGIVEVTIR